MFGPSLLENPLSFNRIAKLLLIRIFFFACVDQKFILLHAIRKKQDTTPEGDKRLALERTLDLDLDISLKAGCSKIPA